MDDQELAPSRGRKRATVVWLSVAAVAILGVGIAVGSRFGAGSAEPQVAAQPQVTTTAVPVATSGQVAPTAARPNSVWLADLPPVESSSIDDIYVESPWTVAPALVRGVTHAKSISATGAWCSTARLVFALDGKYERLTAQVAIADTSPGTKQLKFYVLADDKRVGEIDDVRTTPRPVDIAVTGANRLTIGIEPPTADPGGCPSPERVGVWMDPALTAAGPSAATSTTSGSEAAGSTVSPSS